MCHRKRAKSTSMLLSSTTATPVSSTELPIWSAVVAFGRIPAQSLQTVQWRDTRRKNTLPTDVDESNIKKEIYTTFDDGASMNNELPIDTVHNMTMEFCYSACNGSEEYWCDEDFFDLCDDFEHKIIKQGRSAFALRGKTGHKTLRKSDPFVHRRGNTNKRLSHRRRARAIRALTQQVRTIMKKHIQQVAETEKWRKKMDQNFVAKMQRISEERVQVEQEKVMDLRLKARTKLLQASNESLLGAISRRLAEQISDKLEMESLAHGRQVVNVDFLKETSLCVQRFSDLCAIYGDDSYSLVWHGTRTEVVNGITDNGLIVGGTRGVPRRNGAAQGPGIYASTDLNVAMHYCQNAMFLCAHFPNSDVEVINHGSVLVITPDCIAPVALGFTTISLDWPQVTYRPRVTMPNWPKLFEWEAINATVGEQGQGLVSDLKAVSTTQRMKFGGRYCSIAQVLQKYTDCK